MNNSRTSACLNEIFDQQKEANLLIEHCLLHTKKNTKMQGKRFIKIKTNALQLIFPRQALRLFATP